MGYERFGAKISPSFPNRPLRLSAGCSAAPLSRSFSPVASDALPERGAWFRSAESIPDSSGFRQAFVCALTALAVDPRPGKLRAEGFLVMAALARPSTPSRTEEIRRRAILRDLTRSCSARIFRATAWTAGSSPAMTQNRRWTLQTPPTANGIRGFCLPDRDDVGGRSSLAKGLAAARLIEACKT